MMEKEINKRHFIHPYNLCNISAEQKDSELTAGMSR